MKKRATVHEYREGLEATQRFKTIVKRILSVPPEEIARREEKYRAQRALKPKRGPKPKP